MLEIWRPKRRLEEVMYLYVGFNYKKSFSHVTSCVGDNFNPMALIGWRLGDKVNPTIMGLIKNMGEPDTGVLISGSCETCRGN